MLNKLYLYFTISIIQNNKYYKINLKILKVNKNILNNFFLNLKISLVHSIKLKHNNKLNYLLNLNYSNISNKNFIYLCYENSNLSSYFNKTFYIYKKNFINDINLKLLNNNLFYNISKFKYNKVSILLNIFFKNNFLNILNFIFKSSFLNINPYLLAQNTLTYNCSIFNTYNRNYYNNYNYFIVVNPSLKLVNSSLRNQLISVSISDSLTNNLYITYPIFVNEVNDFSIYFFLCLYMQLYFIGKNLSNLYYSLVFKNYKTLVYIKEYLNFNLKN